MSTRNTRTENGARAFALVALAGVVAIVAVAAYILVTLFGQISTQLDDLTPQECIGGAR